LSWIVKSISRSFDQKLSNIQMIIEASQVKLWPVVIFIGK
jgi:hypothetical protein